MTEKYLTTRQVAEHLQITEQTVRAWLRTGRLAGNRLGSTKVGWRIRASEIERFINESPAGRG
jgi:excisionase family DNA binding protein